MSFACELFPYQGMTQLVSCVIVQAFGAQIGVFRTWRFLVGSLTISAQEQRV